MNNIDTVTNIITIYKRIFNLSSDTEKLIDRILNKENNLHDLYKVIDDYLEFLYKWNIITMTEFSITEDFEEFKWIVEEANNNLVEILNPYIMKCMNYIRNQWINVISILESKTCTISEINSYCIKTNEILMFKDAVEEYINVGNKLNLLNTADTVKNAIETWKIIYKLNKII